MWNYSEVLLFTDCDGTARGGPVQIGCLRGMRTEVQIEATLSQKAALALHEVLNGRLATIQYVEKHEPQNVSELIETEKQAIIQLLMAVDAALRRGRMQ